MPLIAPNHLEARTGRLLNQETASEQGAISSKYLCRAGDVIYSKIRPALAKVVVAPTDCLCSADMYPLSPRHSLQANYLFWLLLSKAFTAWSVLESDRVAMPKINRSTLNSYHLPIPPVSEQAAIVRHLDEAVTNICTATDSARRQIELVQEYRTRLIADVVTGKLDVREAAAQLLDEADDQDLIGGEWDTGRRPARRPLRHRRVGRRFSNGRGGDRMTDWSKCPAVESVPGKVSGAWVFKDTRLPVSALFGNLAEGATVHDFIKWFGGVDEAQVRAVLEFIVQDLDAKVAKVSHANPV